MKNNNHTASHGLLALCAAMICMVPALAFADLRVRAAQEILEAAKADTNMTDHEKLFVYRCQTIAKYLGFTDTPTGLAIKYSCDQTGVGIAFYAGDDLGKHPPEKVAQYFKNELAKQDVNADVFIKHGHEYGSSMAFYINGDSWLNRPLNPLEAIKKIKTLAAEAKLILLTDGRVDKWPETIE